MQLDLPGPAGRLEALYEAPPTPRFAALVCHPHPLHGGTMHNHATYRLTKAARALGGAVLRFNFRGVGRSGGTHDHGRGEADDARAALRWLADRHERLPLLACGFSFGSWMALEAGCADPGVSAVLCAGLGISLRESAADTVRLCPKPVALVQASDDEFGPAEEVRSVTAGAVGARRLDVVPRTTHLFTEDLPGLERAASAALGWLLEAAA